MNDNASERLIRVLEALNMNISRFADSNASIERSLSNIEKQLTKLNERE